MEISRKNIFKMAVGRHFELLRLLMSVIRPSLWSESVANRKNVVQIEPTVA